MEEHSYIYAGGKLLRETVFIVDEQGSEIERTLDFRYDNAGLPYALHYKNDFEGIEQTYYYITNLQGDVMYMVDESGDEVASYEYDPYGKLTRTTGDFAETNPIRYRGYYYDNDTDFYYLQSRYYDPAVCRFINHDNYAATGQGLVGYNMFAYCNNNPITYADPSGHRPIWEKRYGSMVMYTDTGAGGQFSSANEAAQNVGKTMAIMTQSDNLERACAIYKDETNGYYFGEIVTGEHDYVPVGLIWPNEGPYPVAMIHSHPNCTGHVPNDFSYYDELGYPTGDWSVVLNYGIPLYLVAPDGSLLRLTVDPVYIVPEPCVAIISQDLPVDDSIFDCR